MYLKNLQLVGFKSFADKMNIEFLRGVTAIVGPNGCGKSNVSDAIRWVLGEQSAKALRGSEMADIIFNGTDTRKPFGMAEVSLTFTECKDTLKTGQLAGLDTNFDEVTVARRIFRDGNSEYLINKTPCRLKDVQSLFMDTGIGRSAYSIMEQGKIDKILSAHPEDRRAVFEEAAGITKFKSQKKEALRKLEYTEANLLRVTDIIKEVKRQIGSLQRQASKARRYQNVITEIKRLDTQLARHQYEEILSALLLLEKEIANLKIKTGEVRSQLEARESTISILRQELGIAETRRQQLLQRQRDIQSEIERCEIRVRTNVDRITETESSIQASENVASEARVRLVNLKQTLVTTQNKLQESNERLKNQQEDLKAAQAAFQEIDIQQREQDQTINRLQSALLNLEGTLANFRNQASTLQKQQQEFILRNGKLNEDKSIISEEQQRISQRLGSLQTEIHSYKQTFEASRHALTGGEDALRDAENQCTLLATRITEEQRLLSEKTSRRDVLRQLQNSYEGYSEGAQALLRQTTQSELNPIQETSQKIILGTLANLIEVEPQYSSAIEALLGQRLQSIVVGDSQTALTLIEELRSRELGRAWFALQASSSNSFIQAEGPNGSESSKPLLAGALCWASEIVRPQPSIAQMVSRLLRNTVVVSNLHQAFELQKQNPTLTFVTLDGDVLDFDGILSAGSPKALPIQLIGRRNEISTLDSEITQLEATVHHLSADKGLWEGRRVLARQSLGDRQSELRSQENDLTKKEGMSAGMQDELRDLEMRINAIDLENQELERRRHENEFDLARIQKELAATELHQTSLQAELANAQQLSENSSVERHNRNARANDLRVAHATTEQQIQNLTLQIQPLENQATETERFIIAREADAQTGSQRIVQWKGENAEAQKQAQFLQTSASESTSEIARVEAQKSNLDRQIDQEVNILRLDREKIDEIQKTLTDYEIQLSQKRGDSTHLSERILREYQVNLTSIQLLPLKTDQIANNSKKETLHTESESNNSSEMIEQAFDESEQVEEIIKASESANLDFTSWDEITIRVDELRTKIQNMGPINLEAVQEYESLEERYNFLTRENDDLAKSKEQLLEILRKINLTTKQMFAETFEKIRENFQLVFTELFGGGKADLSLSDESDPLECGIDIVAKPPGKQLQSIMLLSGGEKTMTAVSLLFAIYMVKPSPFCVLDEMDAPLDESNINRFTKMLEKFLEHSQFVIITHNKRTIAMADAIYGVTMEERGVSKLVSVKFHKKETVTSNDNEKANGEADPSSPQATSISRVFTNTPVGEAGIER